MSGNNNEHQTTATPLYHHHPYHHHHRHCTSSSSFIIPHRVSMALYALSATRILAVMFILIIFFGAILAAFSLRAVLSKSRLHHHRHHHPSLYDPTRIQQRDGRNEEKSRSTGWNDIFLFSLSAGDLQVDKKRTSKSSLLAASSSGLTTNSIESDESSLNQATTIVVEGNNSLISHHNHKWPSPSFDWKKSTEENYALDKQVGQQRRRGQQQQRQANNAIDPKVFYPSKFASIRETLDYKYHRVYSTSRQLYQDSIIESMLLSRKDCTSPASDTGPHLQQPWIIFTAGVMGAGKTHTVKLLQQKGRFPPNQDFVLVDPDHMRHALPEFEGYVLRSPEQAGEFTRHEAGMMSEILTLAALQSGNNVLVDGSLRDYEWYTEYFARLRRDYPTFHIAILHITAPRQAVLERAKNRAKITGRVVPQKLLEEVMQQVPASVSRLRNIVDFFVEIHNSGNDGEDVQLVSMLSSDKDMNKNVTWAEFTNQWHSTCHEHDHKQALSAS